MTSIATLLEEAIQTAYAVITDAFEGLGAKPPTQDELRRAVNAMMTTSDPARLTQGLNELTAELGEEEAGRQIQLWLRRQKG